MTARFIVAVRRSNEGYPNDTFVVDTETVDIVAKACGFGEADKAKAIAHALNLNPPTKPEIEEPF